MTDDLQALFSMVCGQNPAHTCAFGGVLLPFCERCVGLYAGALLSCLAWLALRPVLSHRFLLIHGAFLLLMAPFGFHLLPHGPGTRIGTGFLFGCGAVVFLMLPLSDRPGEARGCRWYFVVLTVGMLLVLAAARCGLPLIGRALAVIGVSGLAVCVALGAANLLRLGKQAVTGIRAWRYDADSAP